MSAQPLRLMVRRERARDWRVWSISPYAGSLLECLAMETTRNGALAAMRRLYAAAGQ